MFTKIKNISKIELFENYNIKYYRFKIIFFDSEMYINSNIISEPSISSKEYKDLNKKRDYLISLWEKSTFE